MFTFVWIFFSATMNIYEKLEIIYLFIFSFFDFVLLLNRSRSRDNSRRQKRRHSRSRSHGIDFDFFGFWFFFFIKIVLAVEVAHHVIANIHVVQVKKKMEIIENLKHLKSKSETFSLKIFILHFSKWSQSRDTEITDENNTHK